MRSTIRKRDDQLQVIPGIGPSLATDLRSLGIRRPADHRGHDPEALYARLCRSVGAHVDRCVLYAFRCAVYFAGTGDRDPELLKWWNWTDERMQRRGG